MAGQTIAFTEVKHFEMRELEQLKKKTYADIYWDLDTYFCVTVEKVRVFKNFYKEIIPYCQRIITDDGVEIFAAKVKRHLICTEPRLYAILKEHFSIIDECYKDVTDLGGEHFENLNFINWAIKMDQPVRETEFTIPKVQESSTLFCVVS